MKRNVLLAMVGAASILGFAVPANAQESRSMGLSVRLGGFFPTKNDIDDDLLFSVGLDYKIKDLNFDMSDRNTRTALTVSADWYGNSEFSNIPVMLNLVASQNQMYYFLGAGVAFLDVDGGSDETNFTYALGVGYNFQQGRTPVFFEAKYFGNSESALNGFGVYVGARL